MVIASSIDGRVRFRDELFRNAEAAEAVKRDLLAVPGIREVSTNSRAGSLLVKYQQAQTTLRKIADFLGRYLLPERPASASFPARSAPERRSRERRTLPSRRSASAPQIRRLAVNLGMLASLSLSMAGAVLDAMSLHIVAGVFFLGTLAIHLFDKRRSLFI